MFEGYKITEELPRGGQAIVYKAIHLATKTHVAIKVLLPTLLASHRARYYFEREAELISSLDHPNIVSIHDSGIVHNQYYFVMHYVDGAALDGYVRSRDLSHRDRVALFNKICSAVSYAHQQGIIHRDLKFANILVDVRGEPHILDFGLAKAVGIAEQAGREAVATMSGQWAGTLSTMSPEQAAGNPKKLDVRTDIYSLGVILYRMLTGQYPYEIVGSTVEVLRRIQEQEPVRPRKLDRKLDSDIEAILLTALAKRAENRYQSAADLRSDLEHWLQGLPIRVKSVSTAYLVRKIISRHRYTSAVVALLLFIVLSFTYISLYLHISARQARQESREIAKQWTESVGDHSVFAGSIAFTYFLQWWHEGHTGMAEWTASHLPARSKEKRAAVFLLDPAPLTQKEAGFREALSGEAGWFAEFIVGEQHRARGNPQEAVQAYQRSYETLKQGSLESMSRSDQWLARNVAANLYELAGDERREGKRPRFGETPLPMTQQGLPTEMED
jgi:serine/threonine protein kinase